MSDYTLRINGAEHTVTAQPDMPLLWVLRDLLGFTGTKFGCGVTLCRACTVEIDGEPQFSCRLPISAVGQRDVRTVEGLTMDDGTLCAVQQAWVELDVPQCGYCQSGQLVAANALLRKNDNPSSDEIDQALQGNICRCGSYNRIRDGEALAAKMLREKKAQVRS